MATLQLPGQMKSQSPQILPLTQGSFLFHKCNYNFIFSGGAEFHHWTEIHQSHFSGAIYLVPEIGSDLKPGQPFTWVGEMRWRIWAWPTSGWLFWSWLALFESSTDPPKGSASCPWFCFDSALIHIHPEEHNSNNIITVPILAMMRKIVNLWIMFWI